MKIITTFANINRNILLADIPTYASCLNKGGELYMSGFYQEDIPAIQAMCESQGLTFVSYKEKDNWTALRIKN